MQVHILVQMKVFYNNDWTKYHKRILKIERFVNCYYQVFFFKSFLLNNACHAILYSKQIKKYKYIPLSRATGNIRVTGHEILQMPEWQLTVSTIFVLVMKPCWVFASLYRGIYNTCFKSRIQYGILELVPRTSIQLGINKQLGKNVPRRSNNTEDISLWT